MPKALSLIACMILICSLYSLAADRSTTSLASLPPEAQTSIKSALTRETKIDNFTLDASGGVPNDGLGISVAIDGNTVVAGAYAATYNNNPGHGAAYVFVKPPSGWKNMTQVAKLTASDGQDSDYFGYGVAISGNTIVVGAPQASVDGNASQGAAYVFVEPQTGWTNMSETAKLTASDGTLGAGFGLAAAIDGNTIVVGSPFDTSQNEEPGKAYVFVQPLGGWSDMTQTAELAAADGIENDAFGVAVSISSNTVVVGGGECSSCSGTAYVFVEPPAGWQDTTETAQLTPSDGDGQESFGTAVSISGTTVAVGDSSHGFKEVGAVYVFVEPPSGWVNMTQTAELAVQKKSGCLGYSVSTNGDVILAGDKCAVGYTGDAYVFLKPSGGWRNAL